MRYTTTLPARRLHMQKFSVKYGKMIFAAVLVSIVAACNSPLEPKSYDDDTPNCALINGHMVCR
jgi:hypothetical protein